MKKPLIKFHPEKVFGPLAKTHKNVPLATQLEAGIIGNGISLIAIVGLLVMNIINKNWWMVALFVGVFLIMWKGLCGVFQAYNNLLKTQKVVKGGTTKEELMKSPE